MSSPAAAAPKRIAGRLSKPRYTVIALAASGKATSARARRGRFRLRPPARRVTLHLRAPNGTYAGPIVVGRKKRGRRAILGVKAGARLGRIKVRRGYAKVSRRVRKKWVDKKRWARAKRGVPIGAGNFGHVRSRPPRAAVPGDPDVDGIPDPLDIDDDGDLIIDKLDRSPAGRRARAAQGCGPGNVYCPNVFSVLALDGLQKTVNANPRHRDDASKPAFDDSKINSALASLGWLNISIPPGNSVELDCGDPDTGLRYCRKNGSTGRAAASGPGPPFPGTPGDPLGFDPDGDGYGTLRPAGFQSFYLTHGATTDEIKTGQTLIEWVATGVPEGQCPLPTGSSASCASVLAPLQFVFATVPALKSYGDGAGNSATVRYPLAPPTGCEGCPPGEPGTPGNGFPVAPCPPGAPAPCVEGDVVLTLTHWRPQRSRIAKDPLPQLGQSGVWTDIGNLRYGVGAGVGGPQAGKLCPQSALSSMDPQLKPEEIPVFLGGGGGFTDLTDDRPSDPGSTFTYALNLSRCLAAQGISFNSGEERSIFFVGKPSDSADFAQQSNVVFKRK